MTVLMLSQTQIDKMKMWGDLESEEEEEEEEGEEEEEDEDEDDTRSLASGLASVTSFQSSLPSGIETPEVLDLRKGKPSGTLGAFPPPDPLYM
jgi:splicing factor 3B subunit 2